MDLVTIVPGHQLQPDAAAAFARAVGDGAPPQVTSSWRDPAHQAFLRTQWLNRVPGYNFALPPDQSMHCKGLAIDVPGTATDTRTAKGWWTKHGKEYGFYPVANEDWHFEYRSHLDTKKPQRSKENDMPNTRYGNRTIDRRLVKDRWNTLPFTDKNGVSVAFGSVFDTNITVALKAPAGAQVRTRFYKMNYRTGKRGYTYDRESKVDSPITTGNTMMFSLNFKGELGPDERLRVETYTWDDEVSLTSSAYRTHEWN